MNREKNIAKERLIGEFVDDLGSKSMAPGGGGASSLVGAMGISLAMMVLNLTIDKKGYERYREENLDLLKSATLLKKRYLELVDEDAFAFKNLMSAYKEQFSNEKDKEKRTKDIELLTVESASKPLEVIKITIEGLTIFERLIETGNTNLLSDIGTGVAILKGALEGELLNIYVNTKSLKDREKAKDIEAEAQILVRAGKEKIDKIYKEVLAIWNY